MRGEEFLYIYLGCWDNSQFSLLLVHGKFNDKVTVIITERKKQFFLTTMY